MNVAVSQIHVYNYYYCACHYSLSELNIGNIAPDPTTMFRPYDHVANIPESYMGPMGLRRSVTALHNPSAFVKESEPMYDMQFDEAFTGGPMLNCYPAIGYRVPRAALINKSHGRRQFEERTGKPGHIIHSVPQRGMNFFNHPVYAPPPHISAFPTRPNHMGHPLMPPDLQQNVNYNMPPRNAFSTSTRVQNLRFTGQNNLFEGDRSEAQQRQHYPLQQQFNFVQNNQQVWNTSSQYNKTGGSPQGQHLPEAQVQVRNKPMENLRQSPDNWRNEGNLKNIGNIKLPSSSFSSVQLLSYYQSNRLGCPHYTYFDLPNKMIQAQLINPMDGKVVYGEPAINKLEASEHVAAEVLKILSKMHNNKSSASIPAPLKTWWQPNKNQQENVVQDNNETRVLTKVPETKTIIESQFVPLQAVRSQVPRQSSSNPEKRDVPFKENEDDTATVNNIDANISVPKVPDGEVVGVEQKPRRKRKMRIAANFQIKMET